jgi:hypothetical protein
MSRERYLAALSCESPTVIPHQVWLLHPEFITDATGIDYFSKPKSASLRFHELFDVDNGGPVHTDNSPLPRPANNYKEDMDTQWVLHSPFTEPEEMWNYDPDPWGKDAGKSMYPDYKAENFRWCYQPETWDSRRREEQAAWAQVEQLWPGRFTDGRSFYCTTFMWAICVFGWDVFLTALGLDPQRTGQTLERMAETTARMYEYFSTCQGAEFVVPHDDLCLAGGPVTRPEWYRRFIYPQYERIFAPVKAQGKKIIFLSDGDIRTLAGDIAPTVDGFIFESSTPAEFMFTNFGKNKCLIGGIDVRPLTFGNTADVKAEVRRALELGKDCPGYVIACSDTIPANVPLENVYAYFESVEEGRHRNT